VTVPPLAVYLIAAFVLAVLAAVAHIAFWQWRLRVRPREDEVVRATTRDGWDLGLGHRRPKGPPRHPPVLFVHGLAMNRQAFDFGVEAYSMSAFLARSGFDCFALDHRGHGLSRHGPSRRWNLDDYLREDLPAALDAIRAATGQPDVLLVGHSQGALLGMAAAVLHPGRIRALVALAPPIHFHRRERLGLLVALRHLPISRHTRLASWWMAPFVGIFHPAFAEVAINTRNIERPIYRRLMANAIEDLQPGVLEQYAAFVNEDSFRSMDGAVDYRALLPQAHQPALFISAVKDGIAPPSVVEAAFDLWGGPKRYWQCGQEYGHGDVLLGLGAPDVVFPFIRNFLLEQSQPIRAAVAVPDGAVRCGSAPPGERVPDGGGGSPPNARTGV
jgi:pimeloyl-ACP methyl ester carboxylesterase